VTDFLQFKLSIRCRDERKIELERKIHQDEAENVYGTKRRDSY